MRFRAQITTEDNRKQPKHREKREKLKDIKRGQKAQEELGNIPKNLRSAEKFQSEFFEMRARRHSKNKKRYTN